ncbi:VVA0879 family protein [Nocardiopsis synnemataformans]|uniref:VVA0879 family protein n=1 Tax=Nocardiopsis synnemataformans TaxID=61305 RepID=UPI003EBDF065
MTFDHRKLTQPELAAEARARFGDDPLDWAFVCPACKDEATGRDFAEALAAHPRKRDGRLVTASDLLGQMCIGRVMGALHTPPTHTRGCDWTASGLFRGPWEIVLPDGRSAWAFPLAEARTPAKEGAR